MKTCYVSRFGGFGDVLHASHLPRLIKQHYGVNQLDWETNYQGYQILQQNPYIDNLIYVDAFKLTDARLKRNWQYRRDTYDLFFNLINTIEHEYCCNENDGRYYMSSEFRRSKFGKISYYDVMTQAVGLPDNYLGTRGELYYEEEELLKANEWMIDKRQDHDRLYLVNLSGSSLHKKFVQANSICHKLLDRYPQCLIILTGDEHCKQDAFDHERVLNWVGKKNFRTVALITKFVDLTISLESGLPLVAHAFNAPCLQLLTAASPENHCIGAENAYWLQSPVGCSPCHKNPKRYWGCPTKNNMPACVWFDEDVIMQKIDSIPFIKKMSPVECHS